MRGIIALLALLTLSCLPAGTQNEPVWGWIIVPSVRLYQPIHAVPLVDGQYDMDAAGRGVGWLEGTATLETTRRDLQMPPGAYSPPVPPDPTHLDEETGRIVLAGHVDGAFAALDRVQIGDEIIVIDWERAERYRVTEISLTTPGDVSLLYATYAESVALITCAGEAPGYEFRKVIVAGRVR